MSRVVEPTPPAMVAASEALRKGQLVAFPTETVYGLGADARSAQAVQRIFTAKRRPSNHPLIVHLAEVRQLVDWAEEVPRFAWQLAEAFWPGPLTMILSRNARVIDAVTGGQSTIGLRIPSDPVALELLRAFGDGVAAPSANRFGHVSPTTAAHVVAEFGDEVDVVLDGGACVVGIESTIVDLTSPRPRVLRPGHLTRRALEDVLGLPFDENVADAPRVSGALATHYAPRTALRWLERREIEALWRRESRTGRLGVIALEESASRDDRWRALSADPAVYANRLYAELRKLDELALDLILVEMPPDTVAWEAVRDRLRRAAGLG